MPVSAPRQLNPRRRRRSRGNFGQNPMEYLQQLVEQYRSQPVQRAQTPGASGLLAPQAQQFMEDRMRQGTLGVTPQQLMAQSAQVGGPNPFAPLAQEMIARQNNSPAVTAGLGRSGNALQTGFVNPQQNFGAQQSQYSGRGGNPLQFGSPQQVNAPMGFLNDLMRRPTRTTGTPGRARI